MWRGVGVEGVRSWRLGNGAAPRVGTVETAVARLRAVTRRRNRHITVCNSEKSCCTRKIQNPEALEVSGLLETIKRRKIDGSCGLW